MAEAEAIGALEFLQNLGKDALIQLLQRAGDVVVVVVVVVVFPRVPLGSPLGLCKGAEATAQIHSGESPQNLLDNNLDNSCF